jgi:hypothetical protein
VSVLEYQIGHGKPPPEEKYFRAQGGLRQVWGVVADEVMVSGPAGTGKSRSVLEYLYRLSNKHAGLRGLIVRATRQSLTESALVTFEDHVVPGRPKWLTNQLRRVRQSYLLPNGSEIVVGGLDNTAKFMSTEFDWIYVQEAREVEEAAWEDLTTRLRNGKLPFQMIIGDTNPDGPTHWIQERARNGKLKVIESRHEDNPVLFDERRAEYTEAGRVYLGRLDNLTGVRHKRLRLGLWVGAENIVYDLWDPAIHLIEPFAIPQAWPRTLSVDFGYTNPFSASWWAEDEDGRLYRYRQLYGTQRLVRDWAHRIHALSVGDPAFVAIITDHDAEGRADLEAHLGHREDECPDLGGQAKGWRSPSVGTTAAIKDVRSGIEAVSARLRLAGDGRPRLYLVKDALVDRDERLVEAKQPTSTEEEFPRYVWAKKRSQTAGEVMLEEPVKQFDHGLDELRYRVMYSDADLVPYAALYGRTIGSQVGY